MNRRRIVLTGMLLAMSWAVYIGTCPLETSAFAVSVPEVSLDMKTLTIERPAETLVTGSVTKVKGQRIAVLSKNGSVLNQIQMPKSGGETEFELSIPEGAAKKRSVTVVYVRSMPARGIAASRQVKVRIRCGRTQKIKAPNTLTLTNLNTAMTISAKAASGGKLTYRSSNPKIVSVSKSGKIKRKKNGRVTITVRQAGKGNYFPSKKKIRVTSRKSTRKEQIEAAVNWAIRIANDNSFAYGSGSGAHHNGCYFCGTNYGPRKYMKPSRRYLKTYCCNPFVHAAFAHGAQHPKMLAGCRKASGIGMERFTFWKFGCWKSVGKPSYSKLQKGDVLVCSSHVALYIGGGRLAEASGGTWSASSIAVRNMSRSRYGGFSYVMRYKGY